MPAGPKLAVAGCVVVVTVLAPLSWTFWFAGVAVLLLAGAALSRVPLRFLLKRLLLLSPFVLGVAVAQAFRPEAGANWKGVALRSGLCLATIILVSNTTPMSAMLQVLRRIHVPGLLITTIALMHRYLFVLAEEAERMRRARLSRTFSRNRRRSWISMATVIGQLFVRASERAERIFDAMCARGWK